jgi:hypothetical protein
VGRSELWELYKDAVIPAIARFMNRCNCHGSRSSIQFSSSASVSHCFSWILLSNPSRLEQCLALLTEKNKTVSPGHAITIGLLAQVCAGDAKLGSLMLGFKPLVHAFYIREFVSAKVIPSSSQLNGLGGFFERFTTVSDLENELVPSIEKGLLRAPEIVLDVVEPLFRALSSKLDISKLVTERLLKPIFSNIKSSNPKIRAAAVKLFETSLKKCRDPAELSRMATEVESTFKATKPAAVDQRLALAQMLTAFPNNKELARDIPPAVARLISLEQNEAVLRAATKSIAKHHAWALANNNVKDKTVTDAIIKGLKDKKTAIRSIWILRVGEILWPIGLKLYQATPPDLLAFLKALTPFLTDIFKENASNPRAALQSGMIVGSYVITAITLKRLALVKDPEIIGAFRQAEIPKTALQTDSQSSYLVNHRIYTKLTMEEEHSWLMRALYATADFIKLEEIDSAMSESWIIAFMYLICAKDVSFLTNKEAQNALILLFIRRPELISGLVMNGIWCWRWNISVHNPDSAPKAAKTGLTRLYKVVRCICLQASEIKRLEVEIDISIFKNNLVQLLVLCQPQVLSNCLWIDTCQSVGIDPGELVREFATKLRDRVKFLAIASGRVSDRLCVCHCSKIIIRLTLIRLSR